MQIWEAGIQSMELRDRKQPTEMKCGVQSKLRSGSKAWLPDRRASSPLHPTAPQLGVFQYLLCTFWSGPTLSWERLIGVSTICYEIWPSTYSWPSLWRNATRSLPLSFSRKDQRLWRMRIEYNWLACLIKHSNTSRVFKKKLRTRLCPQSVPVIFVYTTRRCLSIPIRGFKPTNLTTGKEKNTWRWGKVIKQALLSSDKLERCLELGRRGVRI